MKIILKELFAYREMIYNLVKKDLRGRYKGTLLGFLWTFINPLMQLIVYTIVFSVILDSTIEKYYLYLFVGLVPWIFFSSAVTGGATSILSQQDMVKKIYFPRAVLPIAYVTSSFFNMLFSFIVIFIVIFISGIGFSLKTIFFLPLIFLVEYILALGVALLSSSLTVYFRDLEHILGILTMAWMYMTPIVYSIDVVPVSLLPIFNLNPMTPIINAYRDILYYQKIPDFLTLSHAFFLGVVFLVIGGIVFSKLQRNFVEEL